MPPAMIVTQHAGVPRALGPSKHRLSYAGDFGSPTAAGSAARRPRLSVGGGGVFGGDGEDGDEGGAEYPGYPGSGASTPMGSPLSRLLRRTVTDSGACRGNNYKIKYLSAFKLVSEMVH